MFSEFDFERLDGIGSGGFMPARRDQDSGNGEQMGSGEQTFLPLEHFDFRKSALFDSFDFPVPSSFLASCSSPALPPYPR